MTHLSKHVGLDTHANTIAVAIADGDQQPRLYGSIANRPEAIRRLLKKINPEGQVLTFWYEAGPTGYDLYRQLTELGHDCHVVAPAMIPRRPGDRIKTDRRDALHLARLGGAGDLTSVCVPDQDQEALRDLTRCREDAIKLQRVARQNLGAFLLRHGRHYDQGKTKWTKTFFGWLADQKFESPVQQIVFQEYVNAVEQTTSRVDQLTKHVHEAARHSKQSKLIEALIALRGIDVITATTIVAELGDITRFDSPRQLMAFLGLVPSENSTGERRRQGGITKTGNGHVRRVLIEASWTYQHPARMTKHLKAKSQHASQRVQAIAWQAQKRLCGRYQHLTARGKLKVVVCTAIARELCGFI